MKDEEIIKKVLDDKLGVVVSEDVKKIMKEAIRLTREDCEKEIEERINKDVYWNALFDREYKRGQKAEREKFEKAMKTLDYKMSFSEDYKYFQRWVQKDVHLPQPLDFRPFEYSPSTQILHSPLVQQHWQDP